MSPKSVPAWEPLEARLRSIEQGDLIAFGAIGIAVRKGSALAERAGLTDAAPGDVVSLSIETASGWYAVLTQDCDVVRRVEDEPCLTVAPVLYVSKATWDALSSGMSNYRMFPLPAGGVEPVDEAHAARIPDDHLPVVDIRYVGSVDKSALLQVPQRHVLVGKAKLRFQEWVGQRFGRESFADAVHERVLPAARQTLDDAFAQALTKPDSDTKVLASVSEWYVRCTDRYVEVMGRLDPDRARAAGTLKKSAGEASYNASLLDAGCRRLTKRTTTTLRGGGYTVRFTFADFDELSASEFETWTHWTVADEPPPSSDEDDSRSTD